MKLFISLLVAFGLIFGTVEYFWQKRLPEGVTLVNENPGFKISLSKKTAETIKDSITSIQSDIKNIRIVCVRDLPLEGSFDAWRLEGETVKYGAVKALQEGDTLDLFLFIDTTIVTKQGWTQAEISGYLGRKLFQGIQRSLQRSQIGIVYPVAYPPLDTIAFPSGLSEDNIFKLTLL